MKIVVVGFGINVDMVVDDFYVMLWRWCGLGGEMVKVDERVVSFDFDESGIVSLVNSVEFMVWGGVGLFWKLLV